jgi:hypothetical protein
LAGDFCTGCKAKKFVRIANVVPQDSCRPSQKIDFARGTGVHNVYRERQVFGREHDVFAQHILNLDIAYGSGRHLNADTILVDGSLACVGPQNISSLGSITQFSFSRAGQLRNTIGLILLDSCAGPTNPQHRHQESNKAQGESRDHEAVYQTETTLAGNQARTVVCGSTVFRLKSRNRGRCLDDLDELAALRALRHDWSPLWILFPLGVAVNRLLTRNEPPPKKWAEALTRFFGSEEWKQEFYPKKTERTLFGDVETERKEANFERIGHFFLKRLETVFAQVAPNPLILTNSKEVPMYLLCFATGNPKGAPTAVKIAKDILK